MALVRERRGGREERVEFDFRDRHYRPHLPFSPHYGTRFRCPRHFVSTFYPLLSHGMEKRGREREVVFRPTRELTSLQLPPQLQLSYTEYVTRGSRLVKMHVRRNRERLYCPLDSCYDSGLKFLGGERERERRNFLSFFSLEKKFDFEIRNGFKNGFEIF